MWLRDHPLVPVIGSAGTLVLVGLLIVSSRTTYDPPKYATAWGGAGRIYVPHPSGPERNLSDSSPQTRLETLRAFAGQTGSFQYSPALPNSPTKTGGGTTEETYDAYALLLASIRPSSYPVLATEDTAFLDEVYAFIPQGLRTVSEPPERSEEAHTFYEYGNEVGSHIETHEAAYGTRVVSVLTDFYSNRTDSVKQKEMRRLGYSITDVGEERAAMEFVPADLEGMHVLLASRYQNAGEKLSDITNARSDKELLERITEYNAAADALATAVVTLATFFAAAEISFASYEPGSVFTFSPASNF